MNDKQLHPILVSIAASWSRRRNSGNFLEKDLPIVQELLQRKYVVLQDDVGGPCTHWVTLTDLGEKKLMEFNRIFSNKQW